MKKQNVQQEEEKNIDKFDRLEIQFNVKNEKYVSATVLKKVRECGIDQTSADRLNAHARSSKEIYVESGVYKVSDEIPISTIKKMSPDASWPE